MTEALRQALMEGERHGSRFELRPPRRALLGPTGAQLAVRAGSSIEFMDHRDYQPGDDIRAIDWSAYARSDRLTVKLHRDEVSPHLDLLIDGSRSMALEGTAKERAAASLAAALAAAAGNSRFSHQAWLASDAVMPLDHGRDRPTAWTNLSFQTARGIGEQLAAAPVRFRRHGLRILVSDLLVPDEPRALLHRLGDGAAALVIVQVLARADTEPPQHGNVRLVDSETGDYRELFVDEPARRRYRERLDAHQARWAQACRQMGAVLVTLIAEQMLESWDLAPLVREELLCVT